MATTSNFGWTTPDDTDLVKDGAAAIRTLGSSIDTSLVDLKGGTTGQVLSKTSNTDMDFTWVAQDDTDAIQSSIIAAKGDLIVGTANDTAGILSVGTNGYTLVADSVETTGLKWAAPSVGTTGSYTPTWTNVTVGNGTQAFNYLQVGKLVQVRGYLVFGSTTSLSNAPFITLPVTAVDYVYGNVIGNSVFLDAGTASFNGYVSWATTTTAKIDVYRTDYVTVGGTTTASNATVNATTPMTWTTNDRIAVQFSYEAA